MSCGPLRWFTVSMIIRLAWSCQFITSSSERIEDDNLNGLGHCGYHIGDNILILGESYGEAYKTAVREGSPVHVEKLWKGKIVNIRGSGDKVGPLVVSV